MSTNLVLFIICFTLLGLCLFFLIRMELRMRRLFRGPKGENLEVLMNDVISHVLKLSKSTEEHGAYITEISQKLEKQGRGIDLLRFNPFKDVGGTQSFAVAIVNKNGDGVVFSSLYSRERMSVFAKPVTGGVSDIELSPEEEAVIEGARKNAQT